jgi:hypothetical protein
LWFNNQAEEAVNFYTSIFKNSKIKSVTRYGEAGAEVSGRPKGTLMTVAGGSGNCNILFSRTFPGLIFFQILDHFPETLVEIRPHFGLPPVSLSALMEVESELLPEPPQGPGLYKGFEERQTQTSASLEVIPVPVPLRITHS